MSLTVNYIDKALDQRFTAQRICHDLKEEYGLGYGYASIKRFVHHLKQRCSEVASVMDHPPRKEAQEDFFKRPLTLHPTDGHWRRPWILRVTLLCSWHGYEEAIVDHRTEPTSSVP